MRILIFILTIAGFISSCKKYKEFPSDVEGDSYIRGRLFLYDTLSRNIQGDPLPKKIVQLFYNDATDTVNNIKTAITDTSGYFVFEGVDRTKVYRITYEEKVDSIRNYFAKFTDIKAPNDTLRLNAFLNLDKEPGLLYLIIDETGIPMKGVTVCISPNVSFFQPGTCNANNWQLITDDKGHALKFNIPGKNRYYVTTYITINGVKYVANDTADIANTTTYIVKTLAKVEPTGYDITVFDPGGTKVPGVSLCLTTSITAYQANDCTNASYADTTNSEGHVRNPNFAPGTYYIIAKTKIGDHDYLGKEQITITKGKVEPKPVTLVKQ